MLSQTVLNERESFRQCFQWKIIFLCDGGQVLQIIHDVHGHQFLGALAQEQAQIGNAFASADVQYAPIEQGRARQKGIADHPGGMAKMAMEPIGHTFLP